MREPALLLLPRPWLEKPAPEPSVRVYRLLDCQQCVMELRWPDGYAVSARGEDPLSAPPWAKRDSALRSLMERVVDAIRDGTARGERRAMSLARVDFFKALRDSMWEAPRPSVRRE